MRSKNTAAILPETVNTPRVLILEPPNQLLPIDTARPNGALGPAFLVAALRAEGIETDYYDGTAGHQGDLFYRRTEQSNGLVRYGASRKELESVIAEYDIVATSSIFTAQTRMHFEIAAIAKSIGKPILTVAGGVNAGALRAQFLQNNFDIVVDGDGEDAIVAIVTGCPRRIRELDKLPLPALDAMPLDTYQRIGIPHAGVLPPGTKFASIQTSRGCQDRCTFCHISVEKQTGNGFLRMFNEERVSDMVDDAVREGVQRLYFEDDNLFFNKHRLRRLAPVLKRDGLEYSNVNGANLRFLFERGEVDTQFIGMLADFGLRELVLPFESRDTGIMDRYATGKYSADRYDSAALVKALKQAGIRIQGNFMIGFADETWESVLRTKEYAREMMAAGLDACGFMIPVPYPGTVDFQRLPQKSKNEFYSDLLNWTDRMHWRARPLFPTLIDGGRLKAAVQEFWEELNPSAYRAEKIGANVQ